MESSAQNSGVKPDFETLYQQYGTEVLRTAYFYLGDRGRAEDVCQEVFVKYWGHEKEVLPGKEKAWLMTVTINQCRDLWRSAWLKRVVLGPPTMELIPSEKDIIEERQEKEELMGAVQKLPQQFREVVLLFYYQGFGISEVAKILGISEGTVASRLSRARSKLEKALKEV